MSLELRILRSEDKKNPIEALINLRSGKLRIDNQEIFVGGYINVTGPQENYDKWLLSVVYPKNRFLMVKKIVEKISNIPNIIVEIKEVNDYQNIYILDLLFPRNTRIKTTTYDINDK